MTVVSLQAESATANPTESEILYRAWCYAKAQWELAENDPANPHGLSDEEKDGFCDAEHGALLAYFAFPVTDRYDVARKMRTFKQEQCWQLTDAPEIVDQLAKDVHGLAFGRRA